MRSLQPMRDRLQYPYFIEISCLAYHSVDAFIDYQSRPAERHLPDKVICQIQGDNASDVTCRCSHTLRYLRQISMRSESLVGSKRIPDRLPFQMFNKSTIPDVKAPT